MFIVICPLGVNEKNLLMLMAASTDLIVGWASFFCFFFLSICSMILIIALLVGEL